MRPTGWLGIAGFASSAFVGLAGLARRGVVGPGEEWAFRSLNGLTPAIRGPVWVVMQAGSFPAVGVATLVARRRDPSRAAALAAAGTSVWGAAKLVKRTVGRGRPSVALKDVSVVGAAQSGLGFPSGHAAVTVTLAAVGADMLPPPAVPAAWAAVALDAGR